jgi:UDP-GlcNAc3NAcA epimerase
MFPKKILTVVGARPQFVKAAAVSRVLRQNADFEEVLVHTGQHFDYAMSEIFFRELDIPAPQEHLAVHGGGHGEMTGRMLQSLEATLTRHKPEWVLVYGDTNSTLAAALAAVKLLIPVAHVEAGMRSFNRRMPEEINRVLTDHISTLLLTPTMTGVRNLAAEGITQGVTHVGDVMYDAMLHAMPRAKQNSTILRDLGLKEGGYALATVHRAETTGDPARLDAVMTALKAEAQRQPLVFPVHPRTRQAIARHGVTLGCIRAVEPVGYIDMVRLLDGAALVMTDSGGLQKEAYFARRPCITLRDETEWPETVAHGWNRLWTSAAWGERSDIADFGRGDAAERVIAAIQKAAT